MICGSNNLSSGKLRNRGKNWGPRNALMECGARREGGGGLRKSDKPVGEKRKEKSVSSVRGGNRSRPF